MKLLMLYLYTPVTLLFSGSKADNTVYVCDSPNAKRYHLKESCRGLSNCTYRIIKISPEQAKKSGKTLCRWED
ncbi:hypothetical protein DYU05_06170 [Mucilaginibacter terrenus]|uniref:Uncharacterized protein n=1 Tax=Mucilaginibacter terrenus TaxID=2482727 RepID=A0A3E2NVZ5_9SPHI|nr:hypothetical protein DYU05_06170 [Mucilaginibacter terrenus]